MLRKDVDLMARPLTTAKTAIGSHEVRRTAGLFRSPDRWLAPLKQALSVAAILGCSSFAAAEDARPARSKAPAPAYFYRELPDSPERLFRAQDRPSPLPDTILERGVKDAFRHASFRLEYLLWDIGEPRNHLLGATARTSVSTVSDPPPENLEFPLETTDAFGLLTTGQSLRTGFELPEATGEENFNGELTFGAMPSLDAIKLNRNNGLRGTFGLPVGGGTLETSAWALQTSTDRVESPLVMYRNSLLGDQPFLDIPNDDPTIRSNSDNSPALNIGNNARLTVGQRDVLARVAVSQPILIRSAGGTFSLGTLRYRDVDDFANAAANPVIDPSLTGAPTVNNPTGGTIYDIFNPGGGLDDIGTQSNYRASFRSSLWGAESNWVMDAFNPNSPLGIRPLAGFRYQNFTEELYQAGESIYQRPVVGQPLLARNIAFTRRIDADSLNQVYGPQIGFRAEYVRPRFGFGVEPKATLGVNTYKANLFTSQILSPNNQVNFDADGEPIFTAAEGTAQRALQEELANYAFEADRTLREKRTKFAPILAVKSYGHVNITDYLRLTASYEFMWTGSLHRPGSNIGYIADAPSLLDQFQTPRANFQLYQHTEDMIVHGLTVGAEFTY